MSVTYTIQDDIAEIKVEGQCTPEELFGGFRNLLASEELTGNTHLLINVGESETLPPPEVIERIAFTIGAGREKFSRRVSVYVTHQVRFGLARQLSAYLDSFDLIARPFYDLPEAVDWLREVRED